MKQNLKQSKSMEVFLHRQKAAIKALNIQINEWESLIIWKMEESKDVARQKEELQTTIEELGVPRISAIWDVSKDNGDSKKESISSATHGY